MSNNNNERYKELRVERKIQTQTPRYVSRFGPPLYVPASHRRIFTIHYWNFHKGTSTKELQIQTGSTQLQLSHTPLHKR